MGRFDRYMLSRLMVVFGFFSLVLILVYWINRAVGLFDDLIADGQSALVFLELTALSLPALIRIVLPIAATIAAIYVTNRLAAESELTVVKATGFSPWRMARPVLVFALIVTGLTAVLTHVLIPASRAQLADREAEIAQNVTARLLTPGEFLSPVDGISVYLREVTPEGRLQDLFLSDTRDEERQMTYTARTAYLVRSDRGPQLVMIDGMAQTYRPGDERLFTTRFEDFTYNIGDLVTPRDRDSRDVEELSTPRLIAATPETQALTGDTPQELRLQVHERNNEALMTIAGVLVGFSALLVGGYSRFGLWRQILGAVLLVVVVSALETVGKTMAQGDPRLWPATYLPTAFGCVTSWGLLTAASRPGLLRRRLHRSPA